MKPADLTPNDAKEIERFKAYLREIGIWNIANPKSDGRKRAIAHEEIYKKHYPELP